MQLQTFIFIGKSGCGKGTQADLIQKYITEHDTDHRPILYSEIGARFREFLKGDTYTQRLSKKMMDEGLLQPEFLAIHIWSHLFINEMDAEKHLVMDGTPRRPDEAQILGTAMQFYDRHPIVVYINVSDDWARARLTSRGRSDDRTPEEVDKRLSWFQTDVMPALESLRKNPIFRFIEINGEQTVEEVHTEILGKVFR